MFEFAVALWSKAKSGAETNGVRSLQKKWVWVLCMLYFKQGYTKTPYRFLCDLVRLGILPPLNPPSATFFTRKKWWL